MDRYILVLSEDISVQKKDDILDIMSEYIKCSEDVIMKADLNNLLSMPKYKEIEDKYYQLWYPSTNILNRKLFDVVNGVLLQKSKMCYADMIEEKQIFVETSVYKEIISKVHKNKTVIISGEPGVGKTMLGKQVALFYLGKYHTETFINVSDMNDLYTALKINGKKVIFFDDFWGGNQLEKIKVQNVSKELTRIIKTVKKRNDCILIITTREYVLEQGLKYNEELRNIGKKRMEFLQAYVNAHHCSFYEALKECVEDPIFKGTDAKDFISLIDAFSVTYEQRTISEVLSDILDRSGYEEMLRTTGNQERLDNLAELKQAVYDYEISCGEEALLPDYLDHIALFTNSDVTDDSDKVKLMTVHAAKGLEFPHVFLCALNEGIFPSKKTSTIEGMEEERRLAFVAMSRAMKSLFLSESHGKNFDGSTRYPSRFILDIDQKFLEYVKKPEDTLIAETKNYIHYSNRYLDGYVTEQTFQVGDKIIHNVFGQGRIKSILSDRNAYMIKFEQIETPRIISFRVPIKRA